MHITAFCTWMGTEGALTKRQYQLIWGRDQVEAWIKFEIIPEKCVSLAENMVISQVDLFHTFFISSCLYPEGMTIAEQHLIWHHQSFLSLTGFVLETQLLLKKETSMIVNSTNAICHDTNKCLKKEQNLYAPECPSVINYTYSKLGTRWRRGESKEMKWQENAIQSCDLTPNHWFSPKFCATICAYRT